MRDGEGSGRKKFRARTIAPPYPADEQDEVVAGDVDRNAERQIAPDDIRFYWK